ncbi:MAG: hypothetical protein UY26_C0003G0224 [Candidatus Jorgensenbacteria bacterium GW2011_GWA1_48_13]|nr:MAG: hypothetical protein UY26_C0003G0224 [Candidatus Jorgensenbacteria bacterium GW2011_GWA1_48_13]
MDGNGAGLRSCQNCKQEFRIEPEDFDFYEKIKVPPPTWCPQCRMIRRFAFTNIWNLYKRSCDKCGKNIISIYSPDKPVIVYCQPCWWADDWDGTEYGLDYDPSRPFFEQVQELSAKAPRSALESAYLTLKNTEYANALGHSKNCYLIFWADYCENAFYSSFLNGLKDSLDCYRMKDSELCYEDVGCNKCYRTFFSEECDACNDVWFSRNCTGCTNCFGCVNLRNKNYYIWNEQYTKGEYFKKLSELRVDSRGVLIDLRKRAYEFWNKHPRRVYTGSALNVRVTGDYIYESKNTHDAYMVAGAEDSRYAQFVSVPHARDCYDYSGWGNGAEKIYEAAVVGEGANGVKFSFECWPDALDNEYSIYAISCKHVFGCVSLKRKHYCILNKGYPKEEYERLVSQIKKDMERNPYRDPQGRIWSYGEFLPINLSLFAYNESLAHAYFPKTEKESLASGFKWHEFTATPYTATKQWVDMPDTLAETPDTILQEVIACASCGKAFCIVSGELALMKNLSIPLPRECPTCRHNARFVRTNPPRLYNRSCQKCSRPIQTSYAPERPEIIYCEECYKVEIA